MRQFCLMLAVSVTLFALLAPTGWAQPDGPYKVLHTAKVGGEGGWDYIYADKYSRAMKAAADSNATVVSGM